MHGGNGTVPGRPVTVCQDTASRRLVSEREGTVRTRERARARRRTRRPVSISQRDTGTGTGAKHPLRQLLAMRLLVPTRTPCRHGSGELKEGIICLSSYWQSRSSLELSPSPLKSPSCIPKRTLFSAAYRDFSKSVEVNSSNGISITCTILQSPFSTNTASIVCSELRSELSAMSSPPRSADRPMRIKSRSFGSGYCRRHQPPARMCGFFRRTVSRFDQYGPLYSWHTSFAGLPQVIGGLLCYPHIGTASVFHAEPSF